MNRVRKETPGSAGQGPKGAGWVRLGELTGPRELSCIDGRHRHATIGAPGGNAGELVLLLGAAERARMVEPLDEERIDGLVNAWMDAFGRFYLHSDSLTTRQLAVALERPDAPMHELCELLRRPPETEQQRLLELLPDPAHLGCGHLGCMMNRPEAYAVRRELVEGVIRAFFRALWRGRPEAVLAVLDGIHEEREVVVVDTPEDEDDHDHTEIPMAEPRDEQRFVLHKPAVRYMRRKGTEWLVGELGLHAETADELFPTVERLGERHLNETITALAAELPVREVVVE